MLCVTGFVMVDAPGPDIRARIDGLLGARTVEHVYTPGGYSPAGRWRVRTASGDRAFVKMARSDHTRHALRTEQAVLRRLGALGIDFAPTLLAFEDDPVHPLLVIEDLGDARWPPPWDDDLIERVRDTLARMHATETDLPSFAEIHAGEDHGWQAVAATPEPFLGTGLATASWLEDALPTLVSADSRARLDGSSLTHFDIRSDNLCLAARGVVLIDWNLACAGHPEMDLGFWLPSLEMEGGPPPERLLPDAPEVAAWVSGFFAARAGLPVIPDAPRVRDVQLAQLRTALPWAARALDLPPPDAARP